MSRMGKTVRTRHRQAKVLLANGSGVDVDEGIRELVFIMNEAGLSTLNSCQENEGTGYIQFRGRLAKSFMHSMLDEWLNAKGIKPVDSISFANPANPDLPGSFSMRWNPLDYGRVIKYARAAMRKVRRG
jgi:hypothetical protein